MIFVAIYLVVYIALCLYDATKGLPMDPRYYDIMWFILLFWPLVIPLMLIRTWRLYLWRVKTERLKKELVQKKVKILAQNELEDFLEELEDEENRSIARLRSPDGKKKL